MPTLADRLGKASRQRVDEVAQVDALHRVEHLLVGDPFRAEADVVRDRSCEQMRILQDDTEPSPEIDRIEISNVHAADTNAPALDVVEAQEQVDQRRLSC